MSHQQKQQYDLKRGLKEQDEIMGLWCERRGHTWTPSSKLEDIHGKFDGILTVGTDEFKIQYKGMIRGPEGCVLIEHTNVAGNKGWGYGEAEYVFQRVAQHKAVTYVREKAINWLVGRLGEPKESDILRKNGKHKPLEWCGRKDRKDVFAYVPYDELFAWAEARWRFFC